MISVKYNEVMKAIEIEMDEAGADFFIRTIKTLKAREYGDHVHIGATNDDRGIATYSPYGGEVYGEIILDILPTCAWDDAKSTAD